MKICKKKKNSILFRNIQIIFINLEILKLIHSEKNMNEIKQSLIEEINKRVQDKILEPSNASLLIKLINNAESKNEAINIAALGTTYKRTGLHFDKRLEKMTDDIKYFRKNEKLSFYTDSSKPVNKLIIGDNYDALQNLLIQYRGAVDVIYIDPPYGKDSMGEFAKTNYENAITRDNLLSMLYPRLILAKQLLSDEGVIFCSIDDKNQAYVKCLFDEVFGGENFVANFIIVRAEGGGMAKHAVIGHDYCLTYAKKIDYYFPLAKTRDVRGKVIEKDGKKYWIQEDWLRKEFGKYGTLFYEEILDVKGEEFFKEINRKIDNGEYILIPKEKDKTVVGKLIDIENDGGKFYTILKHLNKNGIKELKSLNLDSLFAYPKPSSLIFELVSGATFYKKNNNPIILDFFAGSGTTGHAVLDLNKQDGGNRTFILCQLNEKTDVNPSGIAYDVTAKRLKRIMTGECYDGTKDFPWIKENKPYGGNLDVYEIVSVANFETAEGKSAFDVIDETLYGKEKFTTVKQKIDWVCQNFEKTQKKVNE